MSTIILLCIPLVTCLKASGLKLSKSAGISASELLNVKLLSVRVWVAPPENTLLGWWLKWNRLKIRKHAKTTLT